MREYNLYIDGKFVNSKSGRTDETPSPFDGSVVANFVAVSTEDVDLAVAAAKEAFDSGVWTGIRSEERPSYLKKIADKINERAEELVERARRIAWKLKAGTVWINEWHLLNERAPFGGYKQSGIGREFGRTGVEEYMEIKHIHVDDGVPRQKRTWYDTVVPKQEVRSN